MYSFILYTDGKVLEQRSQWPNFYLLTLLPVKHFKQEASVLRNNFHGLIRSTIFFLEWRPCTSVCARHSVQLRFHLVYVRARFIGKQSDDFYSALLATLMVTRWSRFMHIATPVYSDINQTLNESKLPNKRGCLVAVTNMTVVWGSSTNGHCVNSRRTLAWGAEALDNDSWMTTHTYSSGICSKKHTPFVTHTAQPMNQLRNSPHFTEPFTTPNSWILSWNTGVHSKYHISLTSMLILSHSIYF